MKKNIQSGGMGGNVWYWGGLFQEAWMQNSWSKVYHLFLIEKSQYEEPSSLTRAGDFNSNFHFTVSNTCLGYSWQSNSNPNFKLCCIDRALLAK